MIRLDTYQRKLQALLGGAVTTSQPTAIVCYTDKENENQKKFFVESFVATLNNTTAVEICPAPDKAMVREIDSIHIRNNDTVAATVTVRISDNGTNYEIIEVSLLSGDTLVYTKSSGWFAVSVDGQQKSVFGYIDFDTNESPSLAEGRLYWDSGDGSLTLGLKGGNTALQLGQENVALAYNDSGVTITAGSVVAVSGAQGQRPKIVLADADTEPLSAATLGIAAESISNGAEGFVCTFGLVRGIDTSTFTAGNPIYLSQTAGQFTATRPSAPAHTVFLGWVIKVNASSGEVFVNISNGWELDELHNVLISSPLDGQPLKYEQSTGLWKNGTLGASGGGTGLTSFTSSGVVYASSTSTLATSSNFVFDGAKVGIGRTPSYLLDVNGTARFNSTIGVGNTVPSASGAGISFPATQSASSDANTLDDYEEGTWTPTDGSGAGLSFTDVTAKYTKIGNVVTVFAKLTYPSTASGLQAKIDGLPFAATDGGQLMYCSSSTTTTGLGQGYILAGTTTAILTTQTSASRPNAQLSTLVLYFTGTYLT